LSEAGILRREGRVLDKCNFVNARGHPREKDMTKSLHPSLKNSLIALGERYFAGLILEDQDRIAVEQGWTTFLELLPDKEVAENLRKQWSSN